MGRRLVEAMVDTIAGAGVALPGINAEAETAALFAGQWAERCKAPAIPLEGLRLYELVELSEVKLADGKLRQGAPADRELATDWVRAFEAEAHMGFGRDPEVVVDKWIGAGQLWFWEDRQPVAMAAARGPAEGVFRIGPVYTPPEFRGRGYGTACTYDLSRRVLEQGGRPCLYTDLGNPTSNSIYRRIGYRAIAEWVRYRFG
jgi:predicted GNAT family acetyltransferase